MLVNVTSGDGEPEHVVRDSRSQPNHGQELNAITRRLFQLIGICESAVGVCNIEHSFDIVNSLLNQPGVAMSLKLYIRDSAISSRIYIALGTLQAYKRGNAEGASSSVARERWIELSEAIEATLIHLRDQMPRSGQ